MFIRRRRLIDELATEYWLASRYSGSGSWLGAKGVGDLAFPGGSADPTWLPHSTSQNPFGAGVDYVTLPGTSGNYVSTPDAAALDITGDLTLIAYVAANDWTPTSSGRFIAKNIVTSNKVSYYWGWLPTGYPFFGWSPDGTAGSATSRTGTETFASVGIDDTEGWWLAVTLDVDNGASGHDVKFWYSPDGVTWAQHGSTVTTASTTSIHSGSAPLEIGSYEGGTLSLNSMRVARAQVWSGVRSLNAGTGGTLVADFNPNGGTYNSTYSTLTGTGDGLTWTFNKSTSGRRLEVVDRDWWWLGTDDYLSTPDNALFDFGANQDFTVGGLFRAIQDADANVRSLVTKRDSVTGTEGWSAGVEGTTSTSEFRFIAESADTATTVADATWNTPGALQTHITTRIGNDITVYTDATSVGTDTQGGDLANALAVSLGRSLASGSGANYFDGLIAAVAIFRTGLTATQVAQLDAELRALA